MGTESQSGVRVGWVGEASAPRVGSHGMTREQQLNGIAMSLNAIEQRLELLRTRVARFVAKLQRLG